MASQFQLPVHFDVRITGAKWWYAPEPKDHWSVTCKGCGEEYYYRISNLNNRPLAGESVPCHKTGKWHDYSPDDWREQKPPRRLICKAPFGRPRPADIKVLRIDFLAIRRGDEKKLLAFLNRYGDWDLMSETGLGDFWEWQEIVDARLRTEASEWDQVKKRFDRRKIARLERGLELTLEWKDGLPDYKVVVDRCVHALAASIQIDLARGVQFKICPWCDKPFTGPKNKVFCENYHAHLASIEVRERPNSPMSKRLREHKKRFAKPRRGAPRV